MYSPLTDMDHKLWQQLVNCRRTTGDRTTLSESIANYLRYRDYIREEQGILIHEIGDIFVAVSGWVRGLFHTLIANKDNIASMVIINDTICDEDFELMNDLVPDDDMLLRILLHSGN